jgi:gas vesicle protein
MYDNSGISFVKGMLFGAMAGAVAGILLAPKSGVETREDIKKFANEMGDKANEYYKKARLELDNKVTALKAAGKKIDEGKYRELIDEVIAEVKRDGQVTSEVAKKMGEQLKGDWALVKDAITS